MIRRIADVKKELDELKIRFPMSKSRGIGALRDQPTIAELYVIGRDGVKKVVEKVLVLGRSKVGWF